MAPCSQATHTLKIGSRQQVAACTLQRNPRRILIGISRVLFLPSHTFSGAMLVSLLLPLTLLLPLPLEVWPPCTLVLQPCELSSLRLFLTMAAQHPSGPIMHEAVGTEVVALYTDTNETPLTVAKNCSSPLPAEIDPEHLGGNLSSQLAPGHGSDATERDSDTSQGEDHWVCWSCGAQGHPSWQCPVTPMVLTCSHCHRHGHSAAQCLTPMA